MATYTPQAASVNGNILTFNAAAAGDKWTNNRGKLYLIAKNASGANRTVTIPAVTTSRPAQGQFPAQTLGSIVKLLANGEEAHIGPIPWAYNATDGTRTVAVNWDNTAGVSVAGIEAP